MLTRYREFAPLIGAVAIALMLCLTWCLFDDAGAGDPCALLLVLAASSLLPMLALEPAGRSVPALPRTYAFLRADVRFPPPKSPCRMVVA